MGMHLRAATTAAAAVSLMVLTGCTHAPKNTAQLTPKQRIAVNKKQAEEKAKQIAALQVQKNILSHQSDDAKKKLSVLLAQSDAAFRTAQQYKNMAATEKNATKKKQYNDYSTKAQQTANDLAQQLMSAHVNVYDSLSKIRDIDSNLRKVANTTQTR